MTGAMFAMGPCLACRQVFTFNPNTVPSFRPQPHAEKQPICEPCMIRVNALRVAMGNDPHPIAADAYTYAEEG